MAHLSAAFAAVVFEVFLPKRQAIIRRRDEYWAQTFEEEFGNGFLQSNLN